MRIALAIIVLIATCGLVYLLDNPIGDLPAIGRLLDPVNGCWASAEPTNKNFAADLKLPQLKQPVTVWMDERLVPHVHADNDHDIYFMEGYLHATFRLWQMDMETRAAAGRICEVVGKKAFDYDREQRRKGMVYAAENSLKAMEADPRTKVMMDAYSEGINAYIAQLKYRDYPLEYKLMGFAPEPWTNIKSALLLKYMADDLTGSPNDIPLTYLRETMSAEMLELLYPERLAGSSPVIPVGTTFEKPSLTVPKAPADTMYPRFKREDFTEEREDGIGSNNWALSGSKTQSGAAILCNDPHLGLHLPSLWYEVQLQAPGMNVYGASLPGAPGVIIGFNDSVSWGFTNNYRDVKDYYLIKKVDGDGGKYWLDGKQVSYQQRLETIVIKNDLTFVDTVKYTIYGPITYDQQFEAEGGLEKPLAMCWMAHKGTNELLAVYMMNRATSYDTWVDGILNFQCPGQNMAFADRKGNVALWGQGQFVNKWQGQGKYIMDGSKSSTKWGELIPMRENPHVLNPAQGFIASANQCVTDATYPYWYDGDFVELRAWRVNQVLTGMQKASINDMFALQNDTYSILAANTLPIMLKNLPDDFKGYEKTYIDNLKKWNYQLAVDSKEGTIFQIWWYCLYNKIWEGIGNVPSQFYPLPERTMQLLAQADTSKTKLPQLEHLNVLMKLSFKQAMDSVAKAEKHGLEWYKVKNTSVKHLTNLPAFSYDQLKIGGWGNTVNAAKGNHGPSWRMVVQMGKEIEAYGVYPGGQSGNPGSKYYADFLPFWTEGKYNKLLFLPNGPKQNDSHLKYTLTAHQ
ncbi:penicillin acylase family protein [Flavipsychrobacter stenotrophus]|uniref:Penicillin acylase family protein n=1 Tax=Flavipsychrobacter stenotrophus TaxID=2077091 RepID=A0A2S7T1V2_9BACT|nr:penicillin acylase family protein [Flavipsychrobacter stenotrophus]PQJ12841.1 penicillin acylase family protein [Flavipsychrobacter stenotrophus]